MTREYECIKPFSVAYYDIETNSYDELQFYDVEVGSIWEFDNESGSYTSTDIHLNGDDRWVEISVEISEEMLKEFFKEL